MSSLVDFVDFAIDSQRARWTGVFSYWLFAWHWPPLLFCLSLPIRQWSFGCSPPLTTPRYLYTTITMAGLSPCVTSDHVLKTSWWLYYWPGCDGDKIKIWPRKQVPGSLKCRIHQYIEVKSKGGHFEDHIQCIVQNEFLSILFWFCLSLFHRFQAGDKSLSGPMMIQCTNAYVLQKITITTTEWVSWWLAGSSLDTLLVSLNISCDDQSNHPDDLSFLAATKQLYERFNPSVCPSVCPSHLFDFVPIIVSSRNHQELLPMTEVMSMQ